MQRKWAGKEPLIVQQCEKADPLFTVSCNHSFQPNCILFALVGVNNNLITISSQEKGKQLVFLMIGQGKKLSCVLYAEFTVQEELDSHKQTRVSSPTKANDTGLKRQFPSGNVLVAAISGS